MDQNEDATSDLNQETCPHHLPPAGPSAQGHIWALLVQARTQYVSGPYPQTPSFPLRRSENPIPGNVSSTAGACRALGFGLEGLRFGPSPQSLNPGKIQPSPAPSPLQAALNATPKAQRKTLLQHRKPQTPRKLTRGTSVPSEAPAPEAPGSLPEPK